MKSSIEVLNNVFGYTTFRPGQERVIEQVLKGRNVGYARYSQNARV